MATPYWQDYTGIPLIKGLHSFLNPKDAYESAQKAENQGWQKSQDYQQPFWQQGQEQTGRLNTAENNLLNPAGLESQWTQGYETSPYAQQLLRQNQASGLDAASSMGLNGSSAALGNIQQGAGNIVAQDRQHYLNDLMQKYMSGIGLGQNIYNVGAQTGANLGGQAMTHGENQANLQYGANAAPGKLFENLLRGGAGFAAGYMNPGTGQSNWAGGFQGANNAFNPAPAAAGA